MKVARAGRRHARFHLKRQLRRALDLAPPNPLLEALLCLSLIRRIAQQTFIHRRGSNDPGVYRRSLQASVPDPRYPRTADSSRAGGSEQDQRLRWRFPAAAVGRGGSVPGLLA